MELLQNRREQQYTNNVLLPVGLPLLADIAYGIIMGLYGCYGFTPTQQQYKTNNPGFKRKVINCDEKNKILPFFSSSECYNFFNLNCVTMYTLQSGVFYSPPLSAEILR